MLMMAQTFTALHRDQQELIRGELDRVHDLTREIQSLQAELAGRLTPPNGVADQPPPVEREPVPPPSPQREEAPPPQRGKSRPEAFTDQPRSERKAERSGTRPPTGEKRP